jgi:hypothetical protein
MDRRVAAVIWRDGTGSDEPQAALICPLCVRGYRSPFGTARVDKPTAETLAIGLQMDKLVAAQWLRDNLETAGVILTASRDRLNVWLPGLGTLKLTRRPGKLPVMTVLTWHDAAPWTVRFKAQEHSRGGPRLSVAYQGAWGGYDAGQAGPYWQARNLRKEHGDHLESVQHTQGGTIVAEIAIRSAKMTLVIPREQWPDHLAGLATAEWVSLCIATPEGLQLTATVKAKSVRKAHKAIQAIEDEHGAAAIIVQGRLMPGLILTEAGIVVQRKPPTPAH